MNILHFLNVLQVDVANKYVGYHTEKFGYSKPNTDFKLGEMERLSDIGIQENSIEQILSCKFVLHQWTVYDLFQFMNC